MVRSRLIAIICLCWLVAGCSSGGTPTGVSPSHTATASVSQATSPNATVLPSLTPIAASTLWPSLKVQRISDSVNANVHLIFQGSGTPDGRFWLAKLQTRYDPRYGPDFLEQVALYDTSTGAIRTIASAHDNQHGVTGFVADNHWVAWYERGLPEISSDASWTLYVYNIDTGAIKQIENNNFGGYPIVQIDQGKLVWSEVDGAITDDRANFVVRLMDLTTGETRTLAQRAANPVISWPWIGWSQITATTSQGIDGVEQFTNLLTGEQTAIHSLASEKVLVGVSLVYIYTSNGRSSSAFTYIPDIRHPNADNQNYSPSQFTLNTLTFNGRYIGWTTGETRGTPAVYDVQRRQELQFPLQYRPNGTETTFVIGDYIFWNEDPNSDADEASSYQMQHKAPSYIWSILDLRTVG